MDILRPFNEIDPLLLYSKAARILEKYLNHKEIASKIHINQNYFVLKRGTKLEPLFAKDFRACSPNFLKVRAEKHLKEVFNDLTAEEIKLWRYFPPRKYSQFFYATNWEKSNFIDRIFYDIDIKTSKLRQKALEIARELFHIVKEHGEINEIAKDFLVSWTGNSFHFMIFLAERKKLDFYDKFIAAREKNVGILTEFILKELKKKFPEIQAGHEKMHHKVIIDPSQTPPGKLCRIPLGSLHIKNSKPDGISLPLNKKMLFKNNILEELELYNPNKLLKNLKKFSKIIRKLKF